MFIFLISQNVNTDRDAYSSAVVIAYNFDEARLMHPAGEIPKDCHDIETTKIMREQEWVKDTRDITVELIGRVTSTNRIGVVCASLVYGRGINDREYIP